MFTGPILCRMVSLTMTPKGVEHVTNHDPFEPDELCL
jgi:hypothetical protein